MTHGTIGELVSLIRRNKCFRAVITEKNYGELLIEVPKQRVGIIRSALRQWLPACIYADVVPLNNPLKMKKRTYLTINQL